MKPRDPSKRRKRPAYPKPGTGEDFAARRPGTKVGEGRRGQSVKQPTRATQARKTAKRKKTPRLLDPLQPAKGNPNVIPIPAPPNRGRVMRRPGKGMPQGQYPFSHVVRGKPTRKNPWPL